jgi:hypothetical protein
MVTRTLIKGLLDSLFKLVLVSKMTCCSKLALMLIFPHNLLKRPLCLAISSVELEAQTCLRFNKSVWITWLKLTRLVLLSTMRGCGELITMSVEMEELQSLEGKTLCRRGLLSMVNSSELMASCPNTHLATLFSGTEITEKHTSSNLNSLMTSLKSSTRISLDTELALTSPTTKATESEFTPTSEITTL